MGWDVMIGEFIQDDLGFETAQPHTALDAVPPPSLYWLRPHINRIGGNGALGRGFEEAMAIPELQLAMGGDECPESIFAFYMTRPIYPRHLKALKRRQSNFDPTPFEYGTLYREILDWLVWWSDWALKNCKRPICIVTS